MDTNKKFSISLFGFSKKKVNEYILNLCEDFSNQITSLKEQNAEYEKSIAEKDAKIAELDRERLHIAETLLKSKCEAEQILSDAQTKADSIITNVQTEAQSIVGAAKNEADLLVKTAQSEAAAEKLAGQKEIDELEKQKAYVAQCINSLKLDVLSAYEVYMLKLEKSMQHSGIALPEDECIEVCANSDTSDNLDKKSELQNTEA